MIDSLMQWMREALCLHDWVADDGGAEPYVFRCPKCGKCPL